MNPPPDKAASTEPGGTRGFYEQKAATYHDSASHIGERDRLVLDLFPKTAHLRVCDVGCGSGRFLRALQTLGHDAVGLDLSETAVKTVNESGAKAFAGNPETGEGLDAVGREFDVITALDVLEHTFDPTQVLRRLTPLLKPDGCLILSVPNAVCLPARLTLMAGDFPRHESGTFDSGHIRWFTRTNLPGHVAGVGGLKVSTWRGTPLPTIRRFGLWRLEGLQLGFLRFMAQIWPGLWAYQHIARLDRTS